MFDDQIRDGLLDLADGAPSGGNLDAVRSAGLKKRRNRTAGQLVAAVVLLVGSGLVFSQLLDGSPGFINTDVVDQPDQPDPGDSDGTLPVDNNDTEDNNTEDLNNDDSTDADNTTNDADEDIGGSETSDQTLDNSGSDTDAQSAPGSESDKADTTGTAAAEESDPDIGTPSDTDPVGQSSALDCQVDSLGTITWGGSGSGLDQVLRSTDSGGTFIGIAQTQSGAFTDPDYKSAYRYQVSRPGSPGPASCAGGDNAFVCQISGDGRLAWTDSGQARYFVRKSTDGSAHTWLTTVFDDTVFGDASYEPGHVYSVAHPGQRGVPCKKTASLLCQVNSLGTVSWNRGQGSFVVYRSTGDGPFSELGQTSRAGTFADSDYQPGYQYQIGHADLKSPYPCRTDSAFVCVVAAPGWLEWTDRAQPSYKVYRSTDDGDTFTWLNRLDGGTSYTDPDSKSGHVYSVNYSGMNDRVTCY